MARANQSRVDYGPIGELFYTSNEQDPVSAGLAKLRDPGPDGVSNREKLSLALMHKNTEHNAHGTELNQRYESAAVVHDESAGHEVWDRDPGLYLHATTRPGAKIPHVWLTDEAGHKVSTLDVSGRGLFTVVTGLAGVAWRDAADGLNLPYLRTVVIGDAGSRDPYLSWHRIREIDEAGCLLVRPDGYIAWRSTRGVGGVTEAAELLRAALVRVLSTDGEAGRPKL